MSRGFGRVQLGILDALEDWDDDSPDDWFSLRSLQKTVGISRQSCSRALGKLEDAGLVEVRDDLLPITPPPWLAPTDDADQPVRWHTVARLAMPAQEREERRARREAAREWNSAALGLAGSIDRRLNGEAAWRTNATLSELLIEADEVLSRCGHMASRRASAEIWKPSSSEPEHVVATTTPSDKARRNQGVYGTYGTQR